jgi:hypothetical protein
MPVIGFHNSHEQIHPAQLLDDVRHAEEVGFTAHLDTPHAFERASASATPADVAEVVRVSAGLGRHAAWIAEYADLGFDEIYLHHVGKEQRAFLDAFGNHVLPQFDVAVPTAAVTV